MFILFDLLTSEMIIKELNPQMETSFSFNHKDYKTAIFLDK